MFQNLKPQLESVLPSAVNVYIATALIKRAGYQTIEKLLPAGCKRYYLIGTSLPSDADVFQAMRGMNEDWGKTKVYLGNYTFHPKVYLIELASGELTAFIGSANTTYGGLNTNIEMSIQTNDQEVCLQLYEWFQYLFVNAGELTEAFIAAWRKRMQQINKRQAATRSDMNGLKQFLKSPKKATKASSAHFFRSSDYQAYQEINWMDYTNTANLKRKNVWERFKHLDQIIYSQFNSYGLNELFAHYHTASRVSHYQYRKGYTNPRQKSMWLHYGYDRSDFAKGDNFGNHPRIQVILHHDDIGIWLVAGVNNGSRKERDGFRNNLLSTPFFDDLAYNLVNDLGESYWLSVNSKVRGVGSFPDVDSLKQFLLKDDNSDYLIFGRTFTPDDESLAESVIAETILNEFQRLYDLYLLFRKNK